MPYEKIGDEVRSLVDEVPFDIPDSWEWVRLGSIGETNIGLTYKPSDVTSSGIPVLRSNNIQNGQMDYSELLYVNCTVPERAYAHKGDILICARNGSRALVGKSAIVDADDMAFGAFMAIYRSPCNPYIQLFINSYLFRGQLDGATTTTINQVTQEMLKRQLCPLPPIQEQQRIVQKYTELQPLIAAYSSAYDKVQILNTSFPEALKKSILQEAVQGKLVLQDPSDEPAEALLERIRAEKQRLIKEGKIKKDKHESVIFRRDNSHYEKRDAEVVCIDDEIPFEIPENWAWCRFEAATLYVTDYVANGSFASLRENVKTYKEENYALMVKTQDFSNDFTRGLTYTDQKGFDYLQKSRLYGGELMLSNIGASIGKAFIIPTMNVRMTLAPNAIVVKCLDSVMTEYLRYFILSYYGQKMLSDFTAGTAMPKFSKTQLRSALIPVPPYSEQKRIIEMIKRLDVLVCTL